MLGTDAYIRESEAQAVKQINMRSGRSEGNFLQNSDGEIIWSLGEIPVNASDHQFLS
jgi:hypothetical protein